MTRMNRILEFNETSGVVRAEAGVTIDELIQTFLPRGWFLSVTPGTRYVTLGGCIANDVHGKNHHLEGSFSSCIQSLTLIKADGEAVPCSPKHSPQLFWATIGGMGLTGIISDVTLQLRRVESAYLHVEHQAANDLEELLELMAEEDQEYSVAWIDCLASGARQGRGVYMQGRHMSEDELSPQYRERPLIPELPKTRSFPFNMPGGLMNRYSVQGFNAWYYKHESRKGVFASDYQRYFYPLDSIQNWNRLYGKRGFIQYQCVLPLESCAEGLHKLLDTLQRKGQASFLAVLKRMGPGNQGPLSFPMEGYTLAVDIPVSGKKAIDLSRELNAVTLDHEGHVYLAKDALLEPNTFREMYPEFEQWRSIKESVDPDWVFQSVLSQRLEMRHG
jgi:FAD/FMN-containing dehydrogenase